MRFFGLISRLIFNALMEESAMCLLLMSYELDLHYVRLRYKCIFSRLWGECLNTKNNKNENKQLGWGLF